jgi:hypothetical protein
VLAVVLGAVIVLLIPLLMYLILRLRKRHVFGRIWSMVPTWSRAGNGPEEIDIDQIEMQMPELRAGVGISGAVEDDAMIDSLSSSSEGF